MRSHKVLLVRLLYSTLLITTTLCNSLRSQDTMNVTRRVPIGNDLIIIAQSKVPGTGSNDLWGIADKDFKYIVPPIYDNISYRSGRLFTVKTAPSYSPFYKDSKEYYITHIQVNPDRSISSAQPYINEDNIDAFNQLAQAHYGAKRSYTLDELDYRMNIAAGVQFFAKIEKSKRYHYTTVKDMGALIVWSKVDQDSISIPLYHYIKVPGKLVSNDKYLFGHPTKVGISLYDHNFENIAMNVSEARVGYDGKIAEFLYTQFEDDPYEILQFKDGSWLKQSPAINPAFAFPGMQYVHIFVDNSTRAYIQKHKDKEPRLKYKNNKLWFYPSNNEAQGYTGKMSMGVGGFTFIDPNTNIERVAIGYEHELILKRDGRILIPDSYPEVSSFYDYISTSNGPWFKAKDGNKDVLLDGNLKTLEMGEGVREYRIMPLGLAISYDDGSGEFMDFRGSRILPRTPERYVIQLSNYVYQNTKSFPSESDVAIWHNNDWLILDSVSIYKINRSYENSGFSYRDTTNLLGLISNDGSVILPCQFESIYRNIGHPFRTEIKNEDYSIKTQLRDTITLDIIRTFPFRTSYVYNYDRIIGSRYINGKDEYCLFNNEGKMLTDWEFSKLSARYQYHKEVYFLGFHRGRSVNVMLDVDGRELFSFDKYIHESYLEKYKGKKYFFFYYKEGVDIIGLDGKKYDTVNDVIRYGGLENGRVKFRLKENNELIEYNFKTKKLTPVKKK